MKELSTCKNCGIAFIGNYCNNCGEKKHSVHDRSMMAIIEEGFHFITHFDGTFFTTVKTIITQPGKFSADYCMGIRKKYFRPLSFFLLLVVLYLIFPVFHGLAMKMSGYMDNSIFGGYATREIAGLKSIYPDPVLLSETFQHKSEKISKFLLFILIPIMALFTNLIFYKKKKFYFDHFIFSTEELSVFVLWGYLCLPALRYLLTFILPANFFNGELLVGILFCAGFLPYAAAASRRFFQLKKWQGILFSALYTTLIFSVILFIYKFILFIITVRMMK